MKRESNFEVMRTVAMFFIVVYHCLTHGVGGGYGFSINNFVSLLNLGFSDFLLVFSSISVNLYVMVSGYFLADLDFKLSRILRTWLMVCFYSCIITLIFISLSLAPFSIITLGKSFFPLSTDAYWFVTQYIGLLILSPFLSVLVRRLSYWQYVGLLIGGAFICLSIIPDFPLGKRFHVAHGNSVWSFAYLFLIAGFIRHHLQRLSIPKLLTTMALLILFTMACEIFFGVQNGQIHLVWFNYNGLPFILSVVIFILFRQIRIPESKIWNMMVRVAPYTFGIYLIHDHLLVRDWLWKTVGLSSWCNNLLFPLIVLGLCFLLFVVCALMDTLRKKLFTVFRVDSIMTKIDKWSFHDKFFTKFTGK